MASKYTLLMQAKLDKSRTLDKDLLKEIERLQKDGFADIKVRAKFDKAGLKNFTVKGKNAFGTVRTEAAKYKDVLKGTIDATTTLGEQTGKTTKKTNFFAQGLLSAAKTAVTYSIGLGLIYKAMQELGEGVTYIKDLDKEMRNISLVTGETGEVINDLAVDYNNLAKEMGATTLEVAAGSLEWIRQGKTLEETQELLQSTLMLSKLGNVESAEATEHLTAVLNSYKLEAKDATGVVDKLVAIDNASATSVNEMSVAFRKAAVSAAQAGIDINHLAAYVGTVLSVTREAPERVGTAFKTMTARFRDIKSGAIEGEGAINNVEAALSRVTLASGEQMSIMNRQTGEFKDFTVVIEQLAGEWGSLGDIEQENIIKAVAGKHTNARMYGNVQMYA